MKRSRLNPRNETRAESEKEFQFGPLAAYVRRQACAVPTCGRLESQAAHVRGRRAWGAWLTHPDTKEQIGNIAPLCPAHHREQHDNGIKTFERVHGIVLADVARETGEAFKAEPLDAPSMPW